MRQYVVNNSKERL